MIKRTLLLTSLALTTYAQEANYTFVFSNVKNIDNANLFINKYLKNKENVKTIPYEGRYRVVYGNFKTKKEAHIFKQHLTQKLKNLKPFIITLEDNRIEKKQIPLSSVKEVEKLPKKEFVVLNEKKVEKVNPKATIQVKKEEVKKVENMPEIKNETIFGINLEYSLQKNREKFTYGSTDKIDTKDLGTNETTSAYTPTIYIKNGNHKIYASYFYENNNFNKTNSKDINFDGYVYGANSNLNIKEDTKWFTTGYRYLYKDLALGFDIHDYNSELNFSSTSNSATLRKDYTFPSLSIDLNHKLNSLLINYGASYGAKSNELDYYSYYLGLGIDDFIFNNTSFNIGYKNKTIDIKEDKYDGKRVFRFIYEY